MSDRNIQLLWPLFLVIYIIWCDWKIWILEQDILMFWQYFLPFSIEIKVFLFSWTTLLDIFESTPLPFSWQFSQYSSNIWIFACDGMPVTLLLWAWGPSNGSTYWASFFLPLIQLAWLLIKICPLLPGLHIWTWLKYTPITLEISSAACALQMSWDLPCWNKFE